MATFESYIPRLYAEALARSRKQRRFVSRQRFWKAVLASEALADFLTSAVSFIAAYEIQLHLRSNFGLAAQRVLAAGLLYGIFAVLLLLKERANGSGTGLLRVGETESATRISIESLLLLFLASSLLRLNFPTMTFVICLGLAPAFLIVQKQLFSSALRRLRARGHGVDRVVFYGKEETGKRISSSLLFSPQLGFNPVAVVSDDPGGANACMFESGGQQCQPVLVQAGPITVALLKSLQCSLLIAAMPHAPIEKSNEIMDIADQAGAMIAFLPSLTTGEMLWSESMDDCAPLASRVRLATPWHYEMAKRAMDIILSSVLLVVLCPLLAIIAILIRITSPGPALFVQKRVGRNGELFKMYKFRSLFADVPAYDVSPTRSSDPRITSLGRLLRRTSLDELPQLFNVLLGNMSLVGPRPEMPFIVERYTAEQRQRLALLPGITGLWQLSADRAFPIHENMQYDLSYIRNRNLFLDVAILVHTALFAARRGI